MTFVKKVNTGSLSTRAVNSASAPITVHLQVVRSAKPLTDFTRILDKVNEKHSQNVHDTVRAYDKHKTLFDKRASAWPIRVTMFVFLVQPECDDKSCKQHFISFHC